MRVWAKNQLGIEICEKSFGICMGKSQWKLIFSYFLSEFCHFIQPLKIASFFSGNFFGFGGRSACPPPDKSLTDAHSNCIRILDVCRLSRNGKEYLFVNAVCTLSQIITTPHKRNSANYNRHINLVLLGQPNWSYRASDMTN